MLKKSITDFPEIASAPDYLKTWIIRILLYFLLALLLVLFFLTPLIFYIENRTQYSVVILGMTVYYLFLLWGCLKLIGYSKKAKKKFIFKISVSHLGLHFFKINGEIDSILYSELEKCKELYSPDVGCKKINRYGPLILYVYRKGNLEYIYFDKIDVVFGNYLKNHRELRSHFLQGITLFRPDLKIPDYVYSHFFIRKQDFGFDKKEFIKTWFVVILLIIFIFFAIELWINYRFGQSLVF